MTPQLEQQLVDLVQDELYHLRAGREAQVKREDILRGFVGRSYRLGLIDTTLQKKDAGLTLITPEANKEVPDEKTPA